MCGLGGQSTAVTLREGWREQLLVGCWRGMAQMGWYMGFSQLSGGETLLQLIA